MKLVARFNKWFDRVVSPDLLRHLESWQMKEVRGLCMKAYAKGRQDVRSSSTRVDSGWKNHHAKPHVRGRKDSGLGVNPIYDAAFDGPISDCPECGSTLPLHRPACIKLRVHPRTE